MRNTHDQGCKAQRRLTCVRIETRDELHPVAIYARDEKIE